MNLDKCLLCITIGAGLLVILIGIVLAVVGVGGSV